MGLEYKQTTQGQNLSTLAVPTAPKAKSSSVAASRVQMPKSWTSTLLPTLIKAGVQGVGMYVEGVENEAKQHLATTVNGMASKQTQIDTLHLNAMEAKDEDAIKVYKSDDWSSGNTGKAKLKRIQQAWESEVNYIDSLDLSVSKKTKLWNETNTLFNNKVISGQKLVAKEFKENKTNEVMKKFNQESYASISNGVFNTDDIEDAEKSLSSLGYTTKEANDLLYGTVSQHIDSIKDNKFLLEELHSELTDWAAEGNLKAMSAIDKTKNKLRILNSAKNTTDEKRQTELKKKAEDVAKGIENDTTDYLVITESGNLDIDTNRYSVLETALKEAGVKPEAIKRRVRKLIDADTTYLDKLYKDENTLKIDALKQKVAIAKDKQTKAQEQKQLQVTAKGYLDAKKKQDKTVQDRLALDNKKKFDARYEDTINTLMSSLKAYDSEGRKVNTLFVDNPLDIQVPDSVQNMIAMKYPNNKGLQAKELARYQKRQFVLYKAEIHTNGLPDEYKNTSVVDPELRGVLTKQIKKKVFNAIGLNQWDIVAEQLTVEPKITKGIVQDNISKFIRENTTLDSEEGYINSGKALQEYKKTIGETTFNATISADDRFIADLHDLNINYTTATKAIKERAEGKEPRAIKLSTDVNDDIAELPVLFQSKIARATRLYMGMDVPEDVAFKQALKGLGANEQEVGNYRLIASRPGVFDDIGNMRQLDNILEKHPTLQTDMYNKLISDKKLKVDYINDSLTITQPDSSMPLVVIENYKQKIKEAQVAYLKTIDVKFKEQQETERHGFRNDYESLRLEGQTHRQAIKTMRGKIKNTFKIGTLLGYEQTLGEWYDAITPTK